MRLLPSLPLLEWRRGYGREVLTADLLAAVIVTIMLIPQSLAYAMLAGLPPQSGLYASVLPIIAYALLGTSRVLAVGPVAVVSLMTAAAVGEVAGPGPGSYSPVAVAMTLAFLSGGLLLLMGLLRLGLIANFLSHPVTSGFITASAVLIAASQIKTLLGIQADGRTLLELSISIGRRLSDIHVLSATLGLACIVFLYGVRKWLAPQLIRLGMQPTLAGHLAKAGPVMAVIVTTWLCWLLNWPQQGLKIVGTIPQGLPPLTVPSFDLALWRELALPALLISIIGFAESVSVGQTLAARRRQRIVPDQELIALGASNLAAAVTGGFPVTGGLARSVVNFDAGAQTPAAGIYTAFGILLVSLTLTPALHYLPHVVLSATIIVAVLSLADFEVFRRTWRFSRGDFWAVTTTVLTTLAVGVEIGLLAGVSMSLALFLIRTSRPHIAEVGLVPGTEHFRNVHRHAVRTSPALISLRVDESLYFANARALEDRINEAVATRPGLRHVVLQCSAINDIDASALESLESIAHRLSESGIALHMSEVKGPVMDRLRDTELMRLLATPVFLTHFQAIRALTPELPTAS